MSFTIGNVKKFFEDNEGRVGFDGSQLEAAIGKAEALSYLDVISGAYLQEVMGVLADIFEAEIQSSAEHSIIFADAMERFHLQDGRLRKLREDVEKALLDGGFNKYVAMEIRGFEIISLADGMLLYNTVGRLAGENVKDLGAVIMSIGFGEMDLDAKEGKKYMDVLGKCGFICKLFETPYYPEGTGAVYLYVKA